MNRKIIYSSFTVWALFSACTAEQSEIVPKEEKDLITVQARTANEGTTEEKAFEKDQKIIIYNNVTPSDITDPELRGIYQSPSDKDKAKAWTNLPLENQGALGLWKKDMKADDQTKNYVFTATTYTAGQSLEENGTHQVEKDQTNVNSFYKSDFLVARSVYSNTDWQSNGISLLFYHVLSRLDIKLILPIGSESDGYFPDNTTFDTKEITLKNAILNYQVDYSKNGLENREQARVSELKGASSASGDIKMMPPATTPEVTKNDLPSILSLETGNAIMLHFQSILPSHQHYTSGKECLTININGKTYSYAPTGDTLFTFAPGQITTIYLTLYSKKGQTKVKLAGVTVSNWKEDKTNVGDLIEDNN